MKAQTSAFALSALTAFAAQAATTTVTQQSSIHISGGVTASTIVISNESNSEDNGVLADFTATAGNSQLVSKYSTASMPECITEAAVLAGQTEAVVGGSCMNMAKISDTFIKSALNRTPVPATLVEDNTVFISCLPTPALVKSIKDSRNKDSYGFQLIDPTVVKTSCSAFTIKENGQQKHFRLPLEPAGRVIPKVIASPFSR